jgi:hypothetical protein
VAISSPLRSVAEIGCRKKLPKEYLRVNMDPTRVRRTRPTVPPGAAQVAYIPIQLCSSTTGEALPPSMLLSDSHLNQPCSYPHSDLKISKCHTPLAFWMLDLPRHWCWGPRRLPATKREALRYLRGRLTDIVFTTTMRRDAAEAQPRSER